MATGNNPHEIRGTHVSQGDIIQICRDRKSKILSQWMNSSPAHMKEFHLIKGQGIAIAS